MKPLIVLTYVFFAVFVSGAWAKMAERVVDIPTRPGVTQRILLITPDHPRATVILFPGGHGGLGISSNGSFRWGEGNFVVRTREMFASRGMMVAIVDAPSDRQSPPYLGGFRQRPENVADIKAVIAWLRQQAAVPVWLVGTSRGTQSAAFIATQLPRSGGGPDGLVLTSTILNDNRGRPVPDMELDRITIPVLVVHNKRDGCKQCPYAELPRLMNKLTASPRKEPVTFDGGQSRGDPCGPFAYHGYNGIERDVVAKITEWIVAK